MPVDATGVACESSSALPRSLLEELLPYFELELVTAGFRGGAGLYVRDERLPVLV